MPEVLFEDFDTNGTLRNSAMHARGPDGQYVRTQLSYSPLGVWASSRITQFGHGQIRFTSAAWRQLWRVLENRYTLGPAIALRTGALTIATLRETAATHNIEELHE